MTKDHIESEHGISFECLRSALKLDYFGFVRFVNFARQNKARCYGYYPELTYLVAELQANRTLPKDYPWASDLYMSPNHLDDSEGSATLNAEADYLLTLGESRFLFLYIMIQSIRYTLLEGNFPFHEFCMF